MTIEEERDHYKKLAERLAEALKRISNDQEFTHNIHGKFVRTAWYVHFAKEALAGYGEGKE